MDPQWKSSVKRQEKDSPRGAGGVVRKQANTNSIMQLASTQGAIQDGRSINTAKYMKSYEEQEWRKSHRTIKKTNRQTKAKMSITKQDQQQILLGKV